MRWIIAVAALAVSLTSPAAAQGVALQTAVYRERIEDGARTVAPAQRLASGDRVVTILTWSAPRAGRYTALSAVPSRLAVESTSREGLEVSTDGGRNWRALADADAVPAGTTHIRWRLNGGEGRLSYRAVVR